jgi:hypothetical protein
VLVVPGKNGVSMMILEPRAGERVGFSAFWECTKSVVTGRPICSTGATVIGSVLN